MNHPSHATTPADSHAECLSALCDGDISATELEALMNEPAHVLCERWHAYQVIGSVLRGDEPVVAARASADFLSGVRAGLAAEVMPAPALSPAPLASVASASPAANDSIFRWKLVAGLASVAAVAAVGWNVLLTAPGAAMPAAQLARSADPAASPVLVTTAATEAGQTVLVDTRQGRLIRDVGLERLLAEHRQHGGMSALQNPTGFIRNATYDADAR